MRTKASAKTVQHGLHVVTALICLFGASTVLAQEPRRITIVYDAFGPKSELKKDWGYAALVEYGGKRILFDTGNNREIFEHNIGRLSIDLKQLDAVVISHRHGDHTSGLPYLLEQNPAIKVYAPQEGAFFKGIAPAEFLKPDRSLPPEMRYFEGEERTQIRSGSPWDANFEVVTKTVEIFPGVFAITTRSQKPGTVEMNELSLAIKTPKGLAVVVGCSHPGVEKILESATQIDSRLYTVTGGFHLVLAPQSEVERTANALHDTLKVERVAPGHCTSELGFSVLMKRFDRRFDRAGLGTILPLP